jgi:hypothetical protein
LLLALASTSNSGRIIFHRGAYSSGMRAAENFSVSVPLSVAAIRDAIAGVRFVARITQNRLRIAPSRPSPKLDFRCTQFSETRLSLCGVVAEPSKRPHVDAALPHCDTSWSSIDLGCGRLGIVGRPGLMPLTLSTPRAARRVGPRRNSSAPLLIEFRESLELSRPDPPPWGRP